MATAAPMLKHWDPSMKHNDMERWICVYPAYINRKKTRQEGRRLPKENCVDNPSYIEIRDVLSVSNLQFLMENKKYCRENSSEMEFRGRVRVQLRNVDGTLYNNDFPTRESIMLHIASKIPQLKTRQNKPGDSYHQQSQPQSNASGSGGGGGGKKGKGKRR
ncbi:signal recognition particle 19 kDa protein [Drosophila simulans]|uniref:GD13067 n=2 Tax=melanogaster subgroup TaxID=32351 RepID=B4QKC9_DROSI|nr:signal recognition particle 19 kDa protein [Drosophila simulans]XP_033161162.1 signal recognition particle 19 kDa protein [Drosophila mauritiana]EDX09552.1 GD13067 [Drosophila simulans]KMY98067.1 uncharacterized protein Dsimw501_GD13067 [Drosophila simulans]